MRKEKVLMNFSGVLEEQQFYYGKDFEILDLKSLSGTNCYCDDEAKDKLTDILSEFSYGGIHFIDSGNYHYMSRIWIEKIEEPFALAVFDNHTDMQPPAFGGILSCGGWIADSLENCMNLKQVLLIGPDAEAYSQVEEKLKCKTEFLSREQLAAKAPEEKPEFLRAALKHLPEELPVFVSIDKDILAAGEAVANWSQGDTTLSELLSMTGVIFEERNVIGMDVCGERDSQEDVSANCNDFANAELLKLWESRRR